MGECIGRNPTLICVPIMNDTPDQMLVQVNKAKEQGADLVELRLDFLKNFNPDHHLQLLIQNSSLPTLITFRPTWEGGQYDGDESKRRSALYRAMELGADYIDVELKVADEFFDSFGGKKPTRTAIIVSSHNYQSTPSVEEIGNLVSRIQATGADIVKIATTATDITDCARILQVLTHSQVPMIGLVMREKGLMSRILCAKFGGYLTFGTLEEGAISAPGQPTIKDLLDLYNFRRIGPDTKVFGVIGNPVGHSKSPHMFNAAFKSVGFDGIYLPLLVDSLPNFLKTYSSTDFVGYSVTIPHKMAALECSEEVDPIAKAIEAVNCLVKRPSDGKLAGYNFDYVGAIEAIEEGLQVLHQDHPWQIKFFVVIGAGGAGKALAYGGKAKGAKVVIANRTLASAVDLASSVGGKAISLDELDDFAPEEGMILVNTTSVGMKPKIAETPISKKALKNYALVFDAVYTPKLTRLLKEAQETGAVIVYGTEMLANQAFRQYEKFTGLPAPKELMKSVLAKSTQ
ncbi:bifunctional 3-dehydroquinate dehydratase/shikimate dehydrogenase, chloroplastic-like [Chenopodium quinoa]|uniref:bifunctional 3-dehydroquinate dehydratase/shikimate dehydrogenase, chloroplastic-like n=1 Tax=Chenopodium quinoa TaxID=63459 RepID=UPI000B7716A1|nr:bifunctional 3-dehydroquinate dehydratase/shikimate dehydrogenase, chloroplastic-like [Chenopodium quinoa]